MKCSESTLCHGDGPEPDRDQNVSHRHRIYPATTIAGINSGPRDNETGDAQPGSDHHLSEESANDKHDQRVN
jgi:hypothetical protein